MLLETVKNSMLSKQKWTFKEQMKISGWSTTDDNSSAFNWLQQSSHEFLCFTAIHRVIQHSLQINFCLFSVLKKIRNVFIRVQPLRNSSRSFIVAIVRWSSQKWDEDFFFASKRDCSRSSVSVVGSRENCIVSPHL